MTHVWKFHNRRKSPPLLYPIIPQSSHTMPTEKQKNWAKGISYRMRVVRPVGEESTFNWRLGYTTEEGISETTTVRTEQRTEGTTKRSSEKWIAEERIIIKHIEQTPPPTTTSLWARGPHTTTHPESKIRKRIRKAFKRPWPITPSPLHIPPDSPNPCTFFFFFFFFFHTSPRQCGLLPLFHYKKYKNKATETKLIAPNHKAKTILETHKHACAHKNRQNFRSNLVLGLKAS